MFHTEEIKRKEARDLSRFNFDFDQQMKGVKGEAQNLALHIMHVDPMGKGRGTLPFRSYAQKRHVSAIPVAFFKAQKPMA